MVDALWQKERRYGVTQSVNAAEQQLAKQLRSKQGSERSADLGCKMYHLVQTSVVTPTMEEESAGEGCEQRMALFFRPADARQTTF